MKYSASHFEHTLAEVSKTIRIFGLIVLLGTNISSCGKKSQNQEDDRPISQDILGAGDTEPPSNEAGSSEEEGSPNEKSDSLIMSQPTFGRYVGTVKHLKIANDQMAKLDFIMTHEDNSAIQLKAVLSLYFGDFDSKEYVSYHFDDVKYNILTGELIFVQPDQDVSLSKVLFENGNFNAEVRSANSGIVGSLTLQKDGAATPSRPLVESIWGNYSGSCGGSPTNLHLRTYRTTEDTFRVGNTFGAYKIRGSLSDSATFDCGSPQDQCVVDIIKDGSYDYFSGRLNLFGKASQYTCNVSGKSLECGSCQFTKAKSISSKPLLTSPVSSKNSLIDSESRSTSDSVLGGPSSSIQGEYFGYLHHERLDQYQTASINITTYQEPNNGGQTFKMSAVANLFFGDFSSDEKISYTFNPREYNILSPLFAFERVTDDVDAVLQVTSLGNGRIRGVWHSIQFGRVGTFEFRQEKPNSIPSGLNIIQPIAGIYRGPNSVEVFLDTRVDTTPVNSLNPFFPIVFGGYFVVSPGISSRIPIVNGSYDFYVGKIGLEAEQESQVLTGFRGVEPNTLNLSKPANDIMRVQQPFELNQYIKFQN